MAMFAGAQKRVVILGGGFGGAYAAQKLGRIMPADWQVTLIDRNNFLLFYPLLIEAGVGSLEPRHVVVPIRKFMPRRGEFVMAEVREIDLERQHVDFRVIGADDHETMHYDHLVIGLGSVTKLPNVPGLKENGFQLKSLGDAVEFRDRGIRLLEYANTIKDEAKRRAVLRIVIVGANFTGIELAGEYQDFLEDAAKEYPNIGRDEVEVIVVEYANRILSVLDEDLAGFAQRHLEKRGLRILTNTSVTDVRPDQVTLTTGEVIPTYTAVWCAGITPNPLIKKTSGLPVDEKGYILSGRNMQVHGYANVWAIGDCAVVRDASGQPYQATAQNATREGAHVAGNIRSATRSEPLSDFDYKTAGSLAALGCRNAVAKLMGVKLSGFPAWFMYRTIYMLKMPGLGRKIRLIMDWTVDLITKRDVVQLGVRRPEPVEALTDRFPRELARSGDDDHGEPLSSSRRSRKRLPEPSNPSRNLL
jgi:NADH dehydrogenase